MQWRKFYNASKGKAVIFFKKREWEKVICFLKFLLTKIPEITASVMLSVE
jgi:hypothetical protein